MGLSPPPLNGVGLCRSSEAPHPIAFLGGSPFPLLLHFTLLPDSSAQVGRGCSFPTALWTCIRAELHSSPDPALHIAGGRARLAGMHMCTLVRELCPCRDTCSGVPTCPGQAAEKLSLQLQGLTHVGSHCITAAVGPRR